MAKQKTKERRRKTIVIALGGNSITSKGSNVSYKEMSENIELTCKFLINVIKKYKLVLTFGSGPQIGALLLQNEIAKNKVSSMPLDVLDAELEGELGYLITQSLINELNARHLNKPVVSILTQVLVDKNDPAFHSPTKPIGPFYTKEQSAEMKKKGMNMIEDSGRGWRRVVASPQPKKIIEAETVKKLVSDGVIVIAAGGGGIPVIKEKLKHGTTLTRQHIMNHYHLSGIDAVIDKDRASALLASDVGADMLIMLTGVDRVALNYGKENEKKLDKITMKDAKKYLEAGQFPPGSMGPKIEAAIYYLKHNKSGRVIITSPEKLAAALKGKDGTVITNK